MDSDSRIFTIGHSNHAAPVFLKLLKTYLIEVVVDVRSAPFSRFAPHFNRNELENALATHGIEYRFAGELLGGRPVDPVCYRNGVVPEGKADYLSLVDYDTVARQSWYQRGVARLLEIAAEYPTAVMCSEEDPERCHRHHLIAPSLHERGFAVLHIRRDGDVERFRPRGADLQMPLFEQAG
jgi:uncharacterized protein (DUF488 family)